MEPNELAKKIKEALIFFDYKHRGPKEIYVTEAIGCPRKLFFNLKFNASPVVDSIDAVLGKLIHMALPKVLKDVLKADFEVPMEYDLGNGWVLKGRADAVDEENVYEFKFSSVYSQIKPIYYAQSNMYAYILNKKRYYLIIIDKKTFNVDITEGETDEKAFQSIIERIKYVIECLQKNTPPPGPLFEWECKGCTYEIICKRAKEWIEQRPLKL